MSLETDEVGAALDVVHRRGLWRRQGPFVPDLETHDDGEDEKTLVKTTSTVNALSPIGWHRLTLWLPVQRHMCTTTGAPAGTSTGFRRGKKIGNQLCIVAVLVGGWVLRVTSPATSPRQSSQRLRAPLTLPRGQGRDRDRQRKCIAGESAGESTVP